MCWIDNIQTIRIDKPKYYRVRVHRNSRPLMYRYFPDFQMALLFAYDCAVKYDTLEKPTRGLS